MKDTKTPHRRPAHLTSQQASKAGAPADKAHVPLERRIGEVIKHLRLEANLTIADLSSGAGLSSPMLSRIENGMAMASLDSLERLCDALAIVRRNSGYTTESMGSATIADTASTIVVTHGLRATPNVVTATPRGNENVWVSARTSTNFTISRTGTSGALNVDWRAEI